MFLLRGAFRPRDVFTHFSSTLPNPVQTVETQIPAQNPLHRNPHQSSRNSTFPRVEPTNPHPQIAGLCEPCIPQYPNPPLQPRFPLPLNSTAKFSKTHPYLNLAPVAVSLPISTFPPATVTTAGLNNSLFISFPYSVSIRIHLEFASFKPRPRHDKDKPATIPRFHAFQPGFPRTFVPAFHYNQHRPQPHSQHRTRPRPPWCKVASRPITAASEEDKSCQDWKSKTNP